MVSNGHLQSIHYCRHARPRLLNPISAACSFLIRSRLSGSTLPSCRLFLRPFACRAPTAGLVPFPAPFSTGLMPSSALLSTTGDLVDPCSDAAATLAMLPRLTGPDSGVILGGAGLDDRREELRDESAVAGGVIPVLGFVV